MAHLRTAGASIVRRGTVSALFLCLANLAYGTPGIAQSLTVTPVNIQLLPSQKTTTLTVINTGKEETSVQFRTYAWTQPNGSDQLTSSRSMLVSPPIATIAPGETQIVRLVLKGTDKGQEETYRILLDQIPPPAEQGVVHVVLRMSIPIFVQTKVRSKSHMQFHLERSATHISLVAINEGTVHDAIHDLELSTAEGIKLQTNFKGSQYILGGVTRRWDVPVQSTLPGTVSTLQLKAVSSTGPIEQQVRIVEVP